MLIYLFVFAMHGFPFKRIRANNRIRQDSRGIEIRYHGLIETGGSDPSVSITPLNPPFRGLILRLGNLLQKHSFRIPRSQGIRICKRSSQVNRGIRIHMRNDIRP
jgi:hypothetical protein